MKKTLTFLMMAVAMAVVAPKASAECSTLLYGSNDNSSVVWSTAVTPSAVAISSLTATRIDADLNTALSAALGTTYSRSCLQVQVTDAAKVNCGYSAAITTQPAAGFQFIVNQNMVDFPLGKKIGIWCKGIVSTATFIVGGMGHK